MMRDLTDVEGRQGQKNSGCLQIILRPAIDVQQLRDAP